MIDQTSGKAADVEKQWYMIVYSQTTARKNRRRLQLSCRSGR